MKDYRITYHMYPAKDIEIDIIAESEEEAIIFAKQYRSDAFSVKEVDRKGAVERAVRRHHEEGLKTFQVWYTPYGMEEEFDYIEVDVENEKQAREIGAAFGYVDEVIEKGA